MLVYIKDESHARELTQLQIDGNESFFVKPKVNAKSYIFGVYYRPSGQNAAKVNDFISGVHEQLSLLFSPTFYIYLNLFSAALMTGKWIGMTYMKIVN